MEGYSIPSVEYEIYNPLTKEKLNLKYCENEQINISIPVSIDENEIFKYNLNSEFYNDICSTYTTDFKTDISLKDRKKEFINKNMTLCESDCNYASYNNTLKKVKCECDVKYRIKDLNEIKFDKDKLKANLNLKNLINTQVLKCYKKLFTKKGLLHNKGSYILLSIIFIYIISLIYLILKDYSLLKNDIKNIFNFSFDIINSQSQENNSDINKSKYNKFKARKSIDITFKSKEMMLENDYSNNEIPVFNEFLKTYRKENKKAKIILEFKNQKKNKIHKTNTVITQAYNNEKINEKKLPEKFDLMEIELNDCSYKRALLYDKRNFWQYFFSLLKFEHLLLFAIIPSRDYNSKAIKICIFLFTFALFFAENALFLNEDAIHNIYENQGTFDLIYQIPQIIYSNIISFVIDKIIRFLSLSQSDVINEKNIRKKIKKKKRNKKFYRILLIKYILFFIFSFLFLFFFWFYISCFCFVYRNTQIYLITDTLIGFALSLATPFIFYLFSAIFRIYSLNDKRKRKNFIYIISKLLLF